MCDLVTTSRIEILSKILPVQVGSGSARLIIPSSAVLRNPIGQYFATTAMGQLIGKS